MNVSNRTTTEERLDLAMRLHENRSGVSASLGSGSPGDSLQWPSVTGFGHAVSPTGFADPTLR